MSETVQADAIGRRSTSDPNDHHPKSPPWNSLCRSVSETQPSPLGPAAGQMAMSRGRRVSDCLRATAQRTRHRLENARASVPSIHAHETSDTLRAGVDRKAIVEIQSWRYIGTRISLENF